MGILRSPFFLRPPFSPSISQDSESFVPRKTPAVLVLADGSVFRGVAIGAQGQTVGEGGFNTAMTGYQEILTDPSYARQVVTLTYPHIRNTGANAQDVESRNV